MPEMIKTMIEIMIMLVSLPFVALAIFVFFEVSERRGLYKNITHVEFLGWRDVYTERFENTGFSYGTDGDFRSYYGNVRRYAGQEAVFYIEYSNKKPRSIAVPPGSRKFDKLVEFIEKQEKER